MCIHGIFLWWYTIPLVGPIAFPQEWVQIGPENTANSLVGYFSSHILTKSLLTCLCQQPKIFLAHAIFECYFTPLKMHFPEPKSLTLLPTSIERIGAFVRRLVNGVKNLTISLNSKMFWQRVVICLCWVFCMFFFQNCNAHRRFVNYLWNPFIFYWSIFTWLSKINKTSRFVERVPTAHADLTIKPICLKLNWNIYSLYINNVHR